MTNDANHPQAPARDNHDWQADYMPAGVEVVDQAAPGSDDELRVWRLWWGPYLSALSRLGNHSAASRAVDMSLHTTKADRRRFEQFALACHDACEQAVDLLEQIAFVRSTAGETVEIEVVREEFDETGKLVARTATVTKKQRTSDALLIRLLEANRPGKYARRLDHRHGFDGEPAPVPEVPARRSPERIAALIRAMEEAGLVPPVALPPGDPPD